MSKNSISGGKQQSRIWIVWYSLAGLIPLSYIVAQLLSTQNLFVENVYSRGIYPVIAQPVSLLCSLLPVSVTELMVIALPIWLGLGIYWLVKKKTTWLRFTSAIVAFVSILYFVFTFGWALNYSRLPYADIVGLTIENSSTEQLKDLCLDLAKQANGLREQLTADEDTPYSSGETQRTILTKVNDIYAQASVEQPWLAGNYATPKPAIFSLPLAYMKIAGIYSPFTVEAHVNALESDLLFPVTACHEAAHQRGFAREDEANYIAYTVCMQSGDAYYAYSGTLLALINAGNALADADKEGYKALWNSYSKGVATDMIAYDEHWKPYDGEVAEAQEKLNDSYLKYNGQEDGVRSYGRMVDLLLAQRKLERGSST